MKYMLFNIKYISFCICPYTHAPDVPAGLLDELWWDDGPGPPQSCLGDLWAVQIGSLAVVRLVLMPCLWMFNGKGWDPHHSNVVKYHSEHTHMLYIDQEALLICIVYLFVDCILAHSGGFKHATTWGQKLSSFTLWMMEVFKWKKNT